MKLIFVFIGFVFVINGVLKKIGLSFKDMDLVEVSVLFCYNINKVLIFVV